MLTFLKYHPKQFFYETIEKLFSIILYSKNHFNRKKAFYENKKRTKFIFKKVINELH